MQFGYVAVGTGQLMTSRTNGRGVVTRFQYDSASRVSRASLILPADSISRAVTNWQALGWSGTSVDTAAVRLSITGPRSGQVTTFALNRFGAPTAMVDALAQATTLTRLHPTYPQLVTRLITPASDTTTATYDTRGRLLTASSTATSGALATTTYTWDAKWDRVTVIKPPEGDSTTFGIDATTGNRAWQQDARGSTARIAFAYDPATNQLSQVTYPGSTPLSYGYDARGNLTTHANELDMQWSWTNNAIGLTTTAEVPYGDGSKPMWAPRETHTTTYSERNEPLATVRTAGSKSTTVVTAYDAEGNPLTVTRTWAPNPQAIAAQVTTLAYDRADRLVRRAESTGGADSTVYDHAGNATRAITRRGEAIDMTYDPLDRLLTRAIPAGAPYPYPAPNITPATSVDMVPYGFTRPAETQVFTYHPTNQVATATALEADVARTHHRNGLLLTETQSIRTRARTAAPHVYTLTSAYDRNGRRTSMTLGPASLFAGSAMTTTYHPWGAPSAATDIAGNSFTFAYNLKRELQTVTYPGGVTRTMGHDGAGRLSTDAITRAGATSFPYPVASLRNFTVAARNARGQILSATDPVAIGGSFPVATFDSLGHVIRATLTQRGFTLANGTVATFTSTDTMAYDALGNLLGASGGWSLPPTAATYATTHTYTAQGRLGTQIDVRGATSRYTAFAYDAAGNTRFELTKPSAGASQITGERAAFYASDERLLAVDRRISGRRVLEESRYDALGRRVWASTTTYCAPTSALSCVTNAVRRVVWDGSEIVAEIRAPRDTANAATEELDTGFPLLPATAVGDPNPFYGRVVYAPGLATDEPLSVTRYAYRDNPAGGSSLTWPTYTLVPHWDYRGTPVYGLYADGAAQKPHTLAGGQTACPAPGAITTQRCVYLTWPFAGDPYNKARGNVVTLSWQGSLLELQRDGAGLEYKRNRVYDPETGRFTQEDPIGLAGGLNTYGYAWGDPVNFSDPFGLCPKDHGGDGKSKSIADCPKDSAGWRLYRSGAAAAVDDPVFFIIGGLEVRGGKALFASGKLLVQHFERHGAEFGLKSAAQYLNAAQRFFGSKGTETVVRGTDKLFYREATNEFGVLRADGVIRTYFKPQEGRAYFDRIVESLR